MAAAVNGHLPSPRVGPGRSQPACNCHGKHDQCVRDEARPEGEVRISGDPPSRWTWKKVPIAKQGALRSAQHLVFQSFECEPLTSEGCAAKADVPENRHKVCTRP